ncbi:MAG: DNA-binding protein [Ilumatobacteraceae bacterium]|nr:DNA-binding protein [Ilumatobacteraceae bacterium]
MNRERARMALERDLARHRAQPTPAPPTGWVRAIRESLGMSTRELAARLQVTSPRISQIERGEVEGTLTLASLERVANALDCRLEYVLVPIEPLDEMVLARARGRAAGLTASVRQTMALENQSPTDAADRRQFDELAALYVDKRGLWTDR